MSLFRRPILAVRETSTPSAKLLEVERVESGYGRTRILKGVDLQLIEGEVVAVVGPNGAGKTTLLNTISGLTTIYGGEVRFAGARITGMAAHRITRRGVGHCPEGRRIFQRLTVEENLVAGFIPGVKSYAELRDEAFAFFPILHERRSTLASGLSGGQQQMLAVARCLMAQPRLLLLDEPSLGLAPRVVNQILEIILRLAGSGVSIVLVEQNVNVALEICDFGYVLENGLCTMSGPGNKLISDPLLRAVYLPKVGGVQSL
jgi:branched-chain amino acid transport system ATP-binding protein